MDTAKMWPALPVTEGVQTNCWRLETILGILNYVISIISNMANGLWGNVFTDIINTVLFVMFQYHSLYYTIEVTEEMVHIKGGPCEWCADWNKKEDPKHWISAAWCFSSQILKSDIIGIETRQAALYPDYCPRLYCAPINWCCCHKSYSGFYAPWCCDACAGVQCGGWCDGDVYPVWGNNYVEFKLSESPTACLFPDRCTPNIWSACTYNRISYVLRDPSVVDQLKQCGYQVLETAQTNGTGTQSAQGGQTQTDAGAGAPGADTGTAPQQDAPPQYNDNDQAQA